MSVIEQLKTFAKETAHAAFDIEPLISGSIAVWNVPKPYALKLESFMQNTIKQENLLALRRVHERGIKYTSSIYRLSIEKSTIEENNSINLRFALKYTGPFTNGPIPGVYMGREELVVYLQNTLSRLISNLVQQKQPINNEAPTRQITVSYNSKYAQLVGNFQSDYMQFQITPTNKSYVQLIRQEMPLAVNNLSVKLLQVLPTALQYSMNAGGKPWLERVGKVVDLIVEKYAMGK